MIDRLPRLERPLARACRISGVGLAGDEQVLAFVQIAEGDTVSVEELKAFVKERLAGYKRPSQIILAIALPAAPTGKILKHKLLTKFADQLG